MHSLLLTLIRTSRQRPSRDDLSAKLQEQISRSKTLYKARWEEEMQLDIKADKLKEILNEANLEYSEKLHQDYEMIGKDEKIHNHRQIPSLQKLATWTIAKTAYLANLGALMNAAKIPITSGLQMSDIRMLEKRIIKENSTNGEEQEEESLEYLSETPRNGALLKFLKTKSHTQDVKTKLSKLNRLTMSLAAETQNEYNKLGQETKDQTSLPEILQGLKTAVKQLTQ
jgi:hypothetical protein